ncbi:MAG: c-type cytochrome [Pseudomonadota bacterium]|nr:c-type cytochrome [Pseudomonadota bacterium]
MFYLYKFGALFLTLLLLSGCSEKDVETSPSIQAEKATKLERWYSANLVSQGKEIFRNNCAVCHGQKAQGLILPWNQPLNDASYPAPPLNGSAHAWHHPLKGLVFTIHNGGAPTGGKMPSFKSKLSIEEQASAIAYFQNFWPDKIYQAWLDRGGLS